MNRFELPKLRNKRGDIAITLFVILVLVICVYTLTLFNSVRGKISSNIEGINVPEELFLEKQDMEYRMYKLGEECIIDSFEEFSMLNNLDILTSQVSKENYTKNILNCLKKKSLLIGKDMTSEEKLGPLEIYTRLSSGTDVSLYLDFEELTIKIAEFPIGQGENNFNYRPDIYTKINFYKIGLIPPERINEMLECDESEDIVKYIENISKHNFGKAFEIVHPENKDEKPKEKNIISSQKEFLINNEFKKIRFELPSKDLKENSNSKE